MAAEMDRDIFFMREALKEAEKALETGNWPVGCVIVLDDKIISRGYNQVYSSSNKIGHAEIDAIGKVADLLAKRGHEATLYVTYEPCPMCFGAILLNHFKRVVHGPDLDGAGSMHLKPHLSKRFHEDKYQFQADSGILTEECENIFLQGKPVRNHYFFKKRKKILDKESAEKINP